MDGFKEWIMGEMPISNWKMQGDFSRNAKRQYGYNKVDAGILSSPKGVAKIHKKWSNTKENFDFYFVRSAQAYKHLEIGEVQPEFVRDTIGIADYEPNDDAINIIFTNNTAAEKIPMTAWTIAHRLGHAVRRDSNFDSYFTKEIEKDFARLLQELYRVSPTVPVGGSGPYGYSGYNRPNEQALKALAMQVGTMASARNGQLRNFGEFQHELVAQYIITGKIKFNPLPKMFILKKRMAWGNPAHDRAHADYRHNLDDWQSEIEGMAEKYEHYLDSIFQGLVGHTYVM